MNKKKISCLSLHDSHYIIKKKKQRLSFDANTILLMCKWNNACPLLVEQDRGAGGVRETGEERAGGGISTMAGSGREIQKVKLFLFFQLLTSSQRNEPYNVSWLPFNVFRDLKQNLYTRKVKKRKFVLGIKKKTALLPVKFESFPSRLHHRTWMR